LTEIDVDFAVAYSRVVRYSAENAAEFLRQLSLPEHAATRRGLPDGDRVFRLAASDALRDADRHPEADLLEDTAKHVVVHDGVVKPGRYTHRHVQEAVRRAVQFVDEGTAPGTANFGEFNAVGPTGYHFGPSKNNPHAVTVASSLAGSLPENAEGFPEEHYGEFTQSEVPYHTLGRHVSDEFRRTYSNSAWARNLVSPHPVDERLYRSGLAGHLAAIRNAPVDEPADAG
jgi:hypothetical protein